MKELEAIKERAEAATEGPWEVGGMDSGHSRYETRLWITAGEVGDTICDMDGLTRSENELLAKDSGERDADFIAHSRTDIPNLVAALEASLHACTLVDIESNEAQQDWLVSTIRTVITEALA